MDPGRTAVDWVRYDGLGLPNLLSELTSRSARKNMTVELAIFDFDGTLADSIPWIQDVFDQVAERYGFRKLDQSKLDHLRHFNIRQLLSHHDIPIWKLPLIARHMRLLMRRNIAAIAPVAGIRAALGSLAEKGVALGIVTSNSHDNVSQVLGPETTALFRHWECGVSVFGKASKLRKLVRASGHANDVAIFIGDEIRDADAAREARIAFGAVAWGFTHLQSLVAAGVTETFSDPAELVTKLTREGATFPLAD
jgi:phosphoglycolate phosphatase